MTKREFLAAQAREFGVAPSWFERNGLRPEPCDHRPTEWTPRGERPTGPCREADCSGWRLVSVS